MEVNSSGVVLNEGSFVGNGSGLTDVNASWWSGLTGWVSGWFVQSGNDLAFNETKLNATIDSRGVGTSVSAGELEADSVNGTHIVEDVTLRGDVQISDNLNVTNNISFGTGGRMYHNGTELIIEL